MAIAEIRIELPLPAHLQAQPELSSRPQDSLLVLRGGNTVKGELRRYVPGEPALHFFHLQRNETVAIPLPELRNLQLAAPRPLFDAGKDGPSYRPRFARPFRLNYSDGGEEIGEAWECTEDACGLHLFVAQGHDRYRHLFVPFAALHSYQVDDKGTQLVTTQAGRSAATPAPGAAVSADDVDAAFKRQVSLPHVRLGAILLREGLIGESQLHKALAGQKQSPSTPLGEILVGQGAIGLADLHRVLAIQVGIPIVDLPRFKVALEAIRLVPQKLAKSLKVMPLCILRSKLVVAMANPIDRAPLDELRFHTGLFAEPVWASAADIVWAIGRYYGDNINLLASELDDGNPDTDNASVQELSESDNTLVKFVNRMILDAYQQRASDIHIEPYPGQRKSLIRFRKDGTLVNYAELPFNYRNAIVSRVKVMCDLDIAERRKPQDGKINFSKFGPAKIELRVATIPTAGGLEDVVMRILSSNEPLPLDALLLAPYNLENIRNLVTKPYGLFIVCGPTGSGKTTTLHSVLSHINTPERKIWTAEDPVEITQPGLRQVQINPKIGLTFAAAMRAFLRADPDVMMVGEMRDAETASTAIEASLTGHLVLSTLHTNGAPESVARLLDMGMDPFNFSDALLGVLAQRLAKALCPACKERYEVGYAELESLFREYSADIVMPDAYIGQIEALRHTVMEEWRERYGEEGGKLHLYRARGCEKCEQSGYQGRIALHELLVATQRIKRLILERAAAPDLLLAAFNEGLRTLKQDGIDKAFQGHTDIHQVRAVCVK